MNQHSIEARLLLDELSRLDVRLEAAGDRLVCHAPAGRLSPDIVHRIREQKPQLLEQLARAARTYALPEFQLEYDTAPLHFELASAQAWMWLYEELLGASQFYTLSIALRIAGRLDSVALIRAWHSLCHRHAALRTVLTMESGRMCQQVLQDGTSLQICGPLTTGGGDIGLHEAAELLPGHRTPMLAGSGGPLALAKLYVQTPDLQFLLINVHHVMVDGWSVSLLLQELLEIYRAIEIGVQPVLPDLPASYSDYVRWQSAYRRSAAFAADLTFWKNALVGAPESFNPWSSRSADCDAVPEVGEGRARTILESAFVDKVGAWATSNGGTLHTALLAAWCVTLQFWAEQDEFVIGTVVAGRPHPAFETVVGCFINTLPIRASVDPRAGFATVHAELRDRLLRSYEHQYCPIDQIVSSLNPKRSKGRNPLFNVAFLLQNQLTLKPIRGDLQIDAVPLPHPPGSMDLRLVAGMVNDDFTLTLEYARGILDGASAVSLLHIYSQVLAGAVRSAQQALLVLRSEVAWNELPRRYRLIVGSTFTIDPLARTFEYWRDELDLPYSLRVAPYGQVIEALLDPASLMRCGSDHNCLFIRLEDWIEEEGGSSLERLRANATLFFEACAEYRRACLTPLTVWLCPRTSSFRESAAADIAGIESELVRRLGEVSGVDVRPIESYADKYDFSEAGDAYLNEVAHMPYRARVYTAFGTLLARELAAWTRSPLKAVIVDADNTLWHGICGELGAQHVVFDEASLAVQTLLAGLRARGVMICLCSKNAERDVRAVFDERSENILTWTDFSAYRVNWSPKSRNVREIAHELQIALDSIVFVDDNPAECSEVEANCHQVRCIVLPSDRSQIAAFLQGVWDFDVVATSPEARLRLETYSLNQAREQLRQESPDLSDYLRALRLEVIVRPLSIEDCPRVAELTGRTTQFNFSGRRRTAQEVAALARASGAICQVVEVRDRFGAYGLTGVVLASVAGKGCVVDTFLLSCRVLGKRVEYEVMGVLETLLGALGVSYIEIEFSRTDRNQPARMFADEFFSPAAPVDAASHIYKKTFMRGPTT